jgi:hypothetical protein
MTSMEFSAPCRLAPVLLVLGTLSMLAQNPGQPEMPSPGGTSTSANPSVDGIMARVAENQARSQKERSEFVYKQSIKVVSRHTSGKLVQEENTEYLVTPTDKETKKTAVNIGGQAWVKGRYRRYIKRTDSKGAKAETADADNQGVHITIGNDAKAVDPENQTDVVHLSSLDDSIVESFRDDLANDKSKDGLGADLFPLTADEQKSYTFELLGTETRDGREVYRIRFRPKDKNDFEWAGEALIDVKEYAPVLVKTKLSRKIPFAVRALLGTDLPGLGFSVRYQRVADGIWFPVTFGTEFRLHAVFFINRNLTMSLQNSEFKRASAESTIHYAEPKEKDPPTQ